MWRWYLFITPEPKVQAAIHVHNKGDEEKMGMALNHIHEEDPTITIDHNMELKQTIINAQGEMHLAMLEVEDRAP